MNTKYRIKKYKFSQVWIYKIQKRVFPFIWVDYKENNITVTFENHMMANIFMNMKNMSPKSDYVKFVGK